MVQFQHVTKRYGTHVILDDLNLEIKRGTFTVLIGPSGCGKTTSLKMINRLLQPDEGTISVDGQNIEALNPVQLRRQIGYVIQQIGLFPNMTIEQNIEVVPRLLKWPADKRSARTRELLAMVGMEPNKYIARYPSELSGGQQQRIGVLRALAASPPLLLMDEPFGALDPITRDSLQDEIKQIQQELGVTVVFVTHDIDEAVKLADEIVLMRDGIIVQKDRPEQLLSKPVDDFTRDFIGKKRLITNYDVDLVREIMNQRVVTVRKQSGFSESLDLMRKRNVDTLIIVEDDNRLVGMVTVEDIRAGIENPATSVIGDLNISPCPSIGMNAQAREAFEMLMSQSLPFIIAVDGHNRVQGLVTKTSLVRALAGVVWKENSDV